MVKRFTYKKKDYTFEKLAEEVVKGKLTVEEATVIVQKQRAKGKISYEDEDEFWNNLPDDFSSIKIAKNAKWRLNSYKLHERQSTVELMLNHIRDYHDSKLLTENRNIEED